MPIKSIGADSFEQIWALYSVGSYEKAYEGLQNMTGPLSQSSLWLLGEMHFLGRGTRVDMSLARKFLEQSSLKRFSSKYIYPFRKQRPVYSLGGTVWAESRQLRNVSRYSFRFSNKNCKTIRTFGCGDASLIPIVLYYHGYNFPIP